jgi:hypothetical protein
MNEKLTILLEKLATQLGTTTQYLWKVLLSQAKVDGVKSLLYIAFVIITGLLLFKLHRKCSNADDGFFCYEQNEAAIMMVLIMTLIWAVMFFVGIGAASDMLNAFFNPEYWALKEVLDIL